VNAWRAYGLTKGWGEKTGLELDCYIICWTGYDEVLGYYGQANWRKKQFAETHMLFFEQLFGRSVEINKQGTNLEFSHAIN
jgi:hypothetical protein